MRGRDLRGVSIQVDKLTHSIEDAKTGERFETALTRLLPEDIGQIKKSHWLFDWKTELMVPGREVYKLLRAGEEKLIQGLVSIGDRGDSYFVHLIENAKFNRGGSRQFIGVAGNLFAFACKTSFEKGYEGFVAFDSKTNLIEHYVNSIGAKVLYGNRLFLGSTVAKKLILQYFG